MTEFQRIFRKPSLSQEQIEHRERAALEELGLNMLVDSSGNPILLSQQLQPAEPVNTYPGTPKVEIHQVTNDHPHVDQAHIDRANNTVVGYFRYSAINVEFNEPFYRQRIWPMPHDGVQISAIDGIFSYDIDPTLVPTCAHFSPSKEQIAEGSEIHPEYNYYNTVSLPICMCAARKAADSWTGTLHSLCDENPMSSCPDYTHSEWVAVAQTTGHATRLVLQRNILGNRAVSYRVVRVDDDDALSVQTIYKNATYDDAHNSFVELSQDVYGTDVQTTQVGAVDTPAAPVRFLSSILAKG